VVAMLRGGAIMISYQILVCGVWYHCGDDRARYYNHKGQRAAVSLTPGAFQQLVYSGELRSVTELDLRSEVCILRTAAWSRSK
jgi:hypothetical protein